jgi:hypothetical protein
MYAISVTRCKPRSCWCDASIDYRHLGYSLEIYYSFSLRAEPREFSHWSGNLVLHFHRYVSESRLSRTLLDARPAMFVYRNYTSFLQCAYAQPDSCQALDADSIRVSGYVLMIGFSRSASVNIDKTCILPYRSSAVC